MDKKQVLLMAAIGIAGFVFLKYMFEPWFRELIGEACILIM